jgi:DeoR family galactitol utilization operon repressor
MQLGLGDIAVAAGVSEPTVIRFCRQFGYAGMAEFRIALAIDLAGHGRTLGLLEPSVSDKAVVNLPEKRAIAAAARQLLENDRAIIVDSGSTAALFAATLADAPSLAIMTGGLNIVEVLRGAPQHRVMLPGGTVRYQSMSLTGALVGETLAGMHFDTFYLGADAIDPTFGLSTYNEDEARQNAAMIRLAGRVVVLADSSKFRAPALHRIAGLDAIAAIVTDAGLPDSVGEQLTGAGIRLIRAAPVGSRPIRHPSPKTRTTP